MFMISRRLGAKYKHNTKGKQSKRFLHANPSRKGIIIQLNKSPSKSLTNLSQILNKSMQICQEMKIYPAKQIPKQISNKSSPNLKKIHANMSKQTNLQENL